MSVLYSGMMPCLEGHLRPKTIAEAISLMAEHGEGAKVIAGGTDLINLMRTQVFMPEYIIDISGLGLDYVKYDDEDGLRIGALTTLSAMQLSKVVKERYLLLHEAVCQMGSAQTRNRATVGGNLCRAAPSADTASPLLALNAKVKIAGPGKTRIISLDRFFIGPGKTVLKGNEILTEIQVPKLPVGAGTAFLKATRVAIDLAKVNVASVVTVKDGVFDEVRIALGAVAPTPIRARQAEEALRAKQIEDRLIDQAAEIAAGETKCISDLRAPADYRKELTGVLVRRVIKVAIARAAKGMRG